MGILSCDSLRKSVVVTVNLGTDLNSIFASMCRKHDSMPMRCEFFLAVDLGETVTLLPFRGGAVDVRIEGLFMAPRRILHADPGVIPFERHEDVVFIEVTILGGVNIDSCKAAGWLGDIMPQGSATLVYFMEPGPVEGYLLRTDGMDFGEVLKEVEIAARDNSNKAVESADHASFGGDHESSEKEGADGTLQHAVGDDARIVKPGPIEAALVELGEREGKKADSAPQSPNTGSASGKSSGLHINHSYGVKNG